MKVKVLSIIIASLCISNHTLIMAARSVTESTSPTADFYSGRNNLRTIGLGKSAYTEDGKTGVVVNIYQNTDGAYVVQVIEYTIVNGRSYPKMSNKYMQAYRDKNDRILFTWKNRKFHTGRQIFRD